MGNLIFFLYMFLIFSCTSQRGKEQTFDFRKELMNLSKRNVMASAKIEEINGFKIYDYNLPVILEKADLIKKDNELFVKIKGWAIDTATGKPASIVYIDINNKLFKAEYGLKRHNVADESIKNSGFECILPVSEIGFFPRQVSLVVVTSDKKGYYENRDILWLSIVEKNVRSFEGLQILTNPGCILDSINNVIVYTITNKISFNIADTKYLSFSGWAIDSLASDLAGGVYIVIDKTNMFRALYGLKRIDVAEYFNTPQYMYSGFRCNIPIEKVGKGSHKLKLYVINNDYSGYYLIEQELIIEIN